MKKLILIALSASLLLATNGDQMIGLSDESRALGGTGIAHYMGAANALTNPALLAKMKNKNEFIFAGTIFDSDVKVKTTAGSVANPATGVSKTSDEGINVIPSISLSHRINDDFVIGLGMYGTAGMGTDWRYTDKSSIQNYNGKVDLYNMRSSLILMQFAPSLAYGNDTFGIGITAIVQYGSLSVDYDTNGQDKHAKHIGSGSSNDLGFGFQIGGYYNLMKSLTIGAVYKSKIDMEYKNQISDAAEAYGYGSNPAALPAKSDHLEQPAEYGVGVSYDIDAFTMTADVKEIKWSDAKGYKDFGWDDQTVYALGLKYTATSYWVGIGYNYGENPVPNNQSNVPVNGDPRYNTDGDTMNLFNYAMFPATVESTITMGGGYSLSKNLTLNTAYTYAPEVSDTVNTSTVATGYVTTKHSQQAITVAVKFDF